jgi:hypothetical protein
MVKVVRDPTRVVTARVPSSSSGIGPGQSAMPYFLDIHLIEPAGGEQLDRGS